MPNSDPSKKNAANVTRLMRELPIYCTVIALPLVIIGVGN